MLKNEGRPQAGTQGRAVVPRVEYNFTGDRHCLGGVLKGPYSLSFLRIFINFL